jgi:Rad3-related DNA helicase
MNTLTTEKRGKKKYEFKPIDISPFSENNLFRSGEKILLMSATVMNRDAFCEILGIPKEECAFISILSPFPVSNRPIIFSPIASMTKRNIDEGLPKMAEAVRAILKEHKNDKGIIHCHSYKIANYLKRNIRSSRLLLHDSTNRDKVLYKHMNGLQPTVLLSPSMSEGVDLKGDISRFQILCKVPYPYLGDKLVGKRMHKWKWWYPLQTAKTIVQSVGRSVRSTTDHAVTYILDSDWQRFYGKNKDVFPDDFKQCIK